MAGLIFADTTHVLDYQQNKLIETVEYVNSHSTFYKKLFSENNIDTKKINSIADFKQIPFTTKEDIQKHNDDFFVFLAIK